MCRQQALIEVPVETLWELVGDVRRHPEWWPRIIDVQCEELEQGCTFRQVTKAAVGKVETDILVERLEGCRELQLRCLDTGTCSRWLLTSTQEGTFVDVELGMEAQPSLAWSTRGVVVHTPTDEDLDLTVVHAHRHGDEPKGNDP